MESVQDDDRTRDNDTMYADQLFERTWRAAYPALRSRARRLVRGRPDEADDLVAGVALKALQFMRRSATTITDPKLFLFVVLKHVFLDSVRRDARAPQRVDGVGYPEGTLDSSVVVFEHATERWNEHREQLEQVTAALQVMSPEQQHLFVLRFVEELPYASIAERLEISEPLARKRVQLLRTQLAVAVTQSGVHVPVVVSFEQERMRRGKGLKPTGPPHSRRGRTPNPLNARSTT